MPRHLLHITFHCFSWLGIEVCMYSVFNSGFIHNSQSVPSFVFVDSTYIYDTHARCRGDPDMCDARCAGWSSVLWGWAGVMGVGEESNYFLNIADPLNTAFLPIMICAHI